MANRTVSVELIAKVSGYTSKMAAARKATSELLGGIDRLGKQSPEKLNKLSLGIGALGVGLLGVAGYAVKAEMAFDKAMSGVGAAAGATAGDLDRLRGAALEAGKATVFSATEAASAEEELAKAGIKTSDILGGALTGSLDLAAAGTMGLADAATIAAQSMNIFHLSGKAVPHIADVLASGANKSAASMKDLGDALRMGGLVADQAGLSLEDTVGTLSAFADRALIGSDAGTSLKTMLQQLAAPSEKSAKLMKELGVNVYDTQGRFIGITKLAGLLQDKLGGLTQAQRDYAMAQIFGADATRAASVLYNLGEQGLRGYIDAVNDSGAAAETARKKTDNLAGDVERLKGSLETLAIESGSGANGGLRVLVKSVDGLVSSFSKLPGPVQSSATVLLGVSGASLVVTAGFVKARQVVGEFMSTLEGIGPAGARAAGGLRMIGGTAGKLGLAGAAVAGIWLGLDELSAWADRKHAPLKADIDKLTASLKDFAASGKVAGELAAKYGTNLEKIGKDATAITKGQKDLAAAIDLVKQGLSAPETLGNASDYIDPQAVQRVKDLDTALSAMATNGGATQASLALERLRTSGRLSASEFSSLLGMLPAYGDAARGAATANTGLAKGFADAAGKASILNSSMTEQIAKGLTLIDVWGTLHGDVASTDQAMLDANNAVDAVTKSFKENGKAITGNSTAALENRVKIEDVAKAAAKAAQAKYEETGSIEEANKVYQDYSRKLTDSLRKAGDLTAGVQTLVDTVFKMPPAYSVTLSTPGLTTAQTRLNKVENTLNRLDGRQVQTSVVTDFYSYRHDEVSSSRNRWGGVYEKAAVGTLREAAVYSPRSPGRYMIAEPQTGGEAFVPKHGDTARSMGILSQAAGWYGAAVVPAGGYGVRAGGGTGGAAPINVYVTNSPGGYSGGDVMRAIVQGLRTDVRVSGGGDVQAHLGGRMYTNQASTVR